MTSGSVDGGVTGVFHATIVVGSMDRALVFFRDLLGMSITFDAEHDPRSIQTLLGLEGARVRAVVVTCADGSEIELAEFASRKSAPARRAFDEPGINFLSLRASGIEALVERIERAGYRFTSPIVSQPLSDGKVAKVAVCIGPDSIAFTLTEMPAGRRTLAG